MAAFQSLGGFISTFADPQRTGFRLTDDQTVEYDEAIITNSRERYYILVLN